MEQILAFVLGVGIALFVWGVVVAFKTVKKVKKIIQLQFQRRIKVKKLL